MLGINFFNRLFPEAILFLPEESPIYPSNFQNTNEYSQYLLLAQNLIHLGSYVLVIGGNFRVSLIVVTAFKCMLHMQQRCKPFAQDLI